MSEFTVEFAYGNWNVYLPHMCGEWDISCTKDHAEAVADLEAFIAEAQETLAKLRAMKEN